MMKNKYINMASCYCISVLAMICIVACTDEEVVNNREDIPEGDGVGLLQLKMDISSMTDSEDLESKINKVRLVAYNSNTGEVKFNEVYPNDKITNPALILQEVKTGYTDVCIIVNETPSMTEGLKVNNVSKESLRQEVLSYSDFKLFTNKDSLAKYGLPMYKEYDGLPIKITNTQSNPYPLEATVERILAKLSLRVSMNRTHKEVVLDSVTVKSIPQCSWLLSNEYKEAVINSTSKEMKATTDSTYEDINFYIPEYMISDIEKRSYLEIYGTAHKGNTNTAQIDCKYRISLGEGLKRYKTEAAINDSIKNNKLEVNDFKINRNTHYIINVSDIKGYDTDNLTFLVGVIPWVNVPVGEYEGGTWQLQPISQRIPIYGATEFKARFIHTKAPSIVYKWYRSQYKQTEENNEPEFPTDSLIFEEILDRNETSVLIFQNELPTASGDIYCTAAPLGGQHFRKSNHVTLMVIGDWNGGGNAFPNMINWKPKYDMPEGASYLLRDTRPTDEGEMGQKVYRVKKMADGNWWMIQDLAYSQYPAPATMKIYQSNSSEGLYVPHNGDDYFGASCSTEEPMGGYLYDNYSMYTTEQYAEIDGLVQDDALGFTNLQSVCPQGWHIPGNLNSEYNQEWKGLNNVIKNGGLTFANCSLYEYYASQHFNCYTKKYAIYNRSVRAVVLLTQDSYMYHGGICTIGPPTTLGVKLGWGTPPYQNLAENREQPKEIWIIDDPNGDKPLLPTTFAAVSIRCLRDYTK